jgi:hypothetical protein
LGQRHADVMDLLMRLALRTYREPDGRLRLLIDPYPIRRAMASPAQRATAQGGRRAQVALYSREGLDALIGDLMSAQVEWVLRDGTRGGRAPLITEDTWADVDAHDPLTGGRRRLHRITLDARWVAMLDTLGAWYDPTPIARMRHGVSQAVARLCLTHDRRRWPGCGLKLDTVLDWVGVPRTGQARLNARRRVKRDAELFGALGLVVAGGRIVWRTHGTDARASALIPSDHATDASAHATDASAQ